MNAMNSVHSFGLFPRASPFLHRGWRALAAVRLHFPTVIATGLVIVRLAIYYWAFHRLDHEKSTIVKNSSHIHLPSDAAHYIIFDICKNQTSRFALVGGGGVILTGAL